MNTQFRNTTHNMKRLYVSLLNKICLPIKSQILFFILIFLLLSPIPLSSIFIYFGKIRYVEGIIAGISGGLAWTYLFTLGAYFLKNKPIRIIYKVLIYSVIIFLFITYVILLYGFKRYIGPGVLDLIFNTSLSETSEFINTFIGVDYIIFFAVVIISVVLVCIYNSKIQQQIYRLIHKFAPPVWLNMSFKTILTILLVYGYIDLCNLFILCANPDKEIHKYYWRIDDTSGDNLSKTIYSFAVFFEISEKYESWSDNVNVTAFNVNSKTLAESDLKIIFVLGESYICSHSPLYGYRHNTSPNLVNEAKKGNLLVFEDAVTPYNTTLDNIRDMFTTVGYSQNDKWYNSPFFPLLFAKAGWHVNFWDNQTLPKGDANIYNFSIYNFLFNDFLVKNCYTRLYDKSYEFDEQQVDDFISKTPKDSVNELSIIHLWGQHFGVSKRYPNDDKRFRVFDNSADDRTEPWLKDYMKEAIGHYDNATLYNDYVVKKIIDRYQNDNAIIIYFSDHGEEIYDYRPSQGRIECAENKKAELLAVFHVPYFIWMSDKYIDTHPEVVARLRKATSLPIVNTNVSHLIMGLASMQTPYYKPEYDMSSPNYKIPTRIVNEKFDYDKITK